MHQRALQSAIEEEFTKKNFERVLRLVISNLSKFRHFLPLYRYVVMVAISDGQINIAKQVLTSTIQFELKNGYLLDAFYEIFTLKNLLGQIPDSFEEALSIAKERSFAKEEEHKPFLAKPDLSGSRPPVPLKALIMIAHRMIGHDTKSNSEKLSQITLIQDLSKEHFRWIFEHLRIGSRSAGQKILTDQLAVAWIVDGSVFHINGKRLFLKNGTLIGPGEASYQLEAASETKLLTLPLQSWRALNVHRDVADVMQQIKKAQQLLKALNTTRLIRLFTAESQKEILQNLHVFRVEKGPVLKQNHVPSGICIVVEGELRGISRDEDIIVEMGRLYTGDIFAISVAFGDETLDRSFEVVKPTTVGMLPKDVFRRELKKNPNAKSYLENLTESNVLQTGEVLLLDEDDL